MNRLVAFAAIAAVTSFSAVPVAMAQTLAASNAIVMQDHSLRTSKLIGLTVTDDHGDVLGTIVDVLVKRGAMEPTVILSSENRMVAAPISHITVTGTKVVMHGTTMKMIASMPAYQFLAPSEGGG